MKRRFQKTEPNSQKRVVRNSGRPCVYPGKKGQPYRSLRLVAFQEALYDLAALKLAEELCGRDAVLFLVDGEGAITFASYPRNSAYLLDLREKINEMIENALKK